MADDDLLWFADGIMHRITLNDAGSIRGDAIITVQQIRGHERPQTATLNRLERYELARALYPDAFVEGATQALHEEYGVRDRRGTMLRENAYLTPFLAKFVGFPADCTLMVRDVGEWRTAPDQDDID